MKAVIVSIGDEVLTGEVADTNAAWLAERLLELGVEVAYHTCVGDTEEHIKQSLRYASHRVNLVVATGGLGPTNDDLTRHAVAKAAQAPLELHEESLAAIEERFRRFGRPLPAQNRIQAMIPQGATVLPNSEGTAPGFVCRLNDAYVAFLPGVPREMKAMFETSLAPFITALPIERRAVRVERLHTFGLPESVVNEKLGPLMLRGSNPLLGLRVSGGVVSIKLLATGARESAAERLLGPTVETVRQRLGEAIFGSGGDTMELAVARLLECHGTTLAVAESCTGGLVGHLLTNVPGISRCLLEDLVTYSNTAKTELLGVPAEMIQSVGAVSEEAARAMAEGVRRRAKADIGLSTTGIAGPTGGSDAKPVGLVYIGLATKDGTRVERVQLVGGREVIKDRAAKYALNILRLHLRKMGDWSKCQDVTRDA
ncbi:MAG TPA: competence/damage-inducible protein A [Planctomycetota bacterium]|nr:competence/damage-inducible protein A [Planctomycetota bacterium]